MILKNIKKHFFLIGFLLVVIIFYYPFLFQGKLPISADTIIGLYHPFRDFYAADFPNGIPFKNFLITDPVRQTYIWKELAIEGIARGQLPIWNPYEMAGKPLLGNFQAGVFYPLNLLFFIKPFSYAWGYFILSQTLLSGLFIYIYLRSIGLLRVASIFGSISFSFSGFMVAWLEWGNIVHTVLWLPLILLSIDKIFCDIQNHKYQSRKDSLLASFKSRRYLLWNLVLVFSFVSSFLAGHLQMFFYVFIFAAVYSSTRWFRFGIQVKAFFSFLGLGIIFFTLSIIQWIETARFIFLSSRFSDQSYLQEGWFLPWRNLIQFIVPDFFGNPSTLNYWGTWNYAEFIGYIGIIPLIFVLIAIINRHDKKTLFFSVAVFSSLLFMLPGFISKIPFVFNIPFISTAQPTRLIFIIIFSLSSLCALGVDYYIRNQDRLKLKLLLLPVGLIIAILLSVWIFTLMGSISFFENQANIEVAKRNLLLPSVLIITGSILIMARIVFKSRKIKYLLLIMLFTFSAFDLLRFANKFTPFTKVEYLFPKTKTIEFLKQQQGVFRISSLDQRILPPNFATNYRLQSIEGYDPLYLSTYAEYIAALERGEPNINLPFGFNRIITPHNYNSQLYDFLNVKYVLSLSEINSEKLVEVFREGQTIVYENVDVFPRAFFVESVNKRSSSQDSIRSIFQSNLLTTAVVEAQSLTKDNYSVGTVEIVSYNSGEVILKTINDGEGFLVISDVFYPTWKVTIDGQEGVIIKTNHAFRGVEVPKGNHTIIFSISLF